MFRFRLIIAGLLVGCLGLLASLQAVPSVSRDSSLDLTGYQDQSGAITTYLNGDIAEVYFGLYALELARKGGLDVSDVQSRFIVWALNAQRPDGRFERFRKVTTQLADGRVRTEWVAFGRPDSDDATLARWILLLHQATEGALPASWADSSARAEAALLSLQMGPKDKYPGIFRVFPKGTKARNGGSLDNYALFKDNVEVLSAFEQMHALLRRRGDPRAAVYEERVRELRAAMVKWFGDDPFDMKRMALGAGYGADASRHTIWYPHAVSIPFGWLEGYFPEPTVRDWALWLADHREQWEQNAERDYPWGVIAYALLQTGPAHWQEHNCWLHRYTPNRENNKRWFVIEETVAQVIDAHAKGREPQCNRAF